jgi:hypothetical protein
LAKAIGAPISRAQASVFFAGAGEGGESGAGGGNRLVDIGGTTAGDFGEGFLGRGIDDGDPVRGNRVYPGAVDIEFEVIGHGALLSGRDMAQSLVWK